MSTVEERELLERRARALARPHPAEDAPGELLDVVVFSAAGARYAADARCVAEAFELDAITRVPCTPPALLGIVNQRGRVLPVYDLARLLGRAGGGSYGWVVAVELDGLAFGLAADGVEETAPLPRAGLAPPPAGPLLGVTGDLVAVLDLGALAADPRLHIDDSELP